MTDQPAPDFEEARRIADLYRGEHREVIGKLARAYLALLNEREAREEVIEAARALMHEPLLAGEPEDIGQVRLLEALAALPATESAQAEQAHTKECEERRYLHHVATGGDLEDCFCPLPTEESAQAEQPTSEAGS